MMGLSDGRKSFPICLAVLIQYRSVTATQPATQPPSHVAVAITLNAKASSLKTIWLNVCGHGVGVFLASYNLFPSDL